jgi:hypothetical protein
MADGIQQLPRAIMGGRQVQNADIATSGITNPKIANDTIRPGKLNRRYLFEEFLHEPVTSARLGGAATGATGDRNQALFPETAFEWHVKGTQTILTPILTAVGWDIGMDQTAADGIELTNGILPRCPVAFVVGTDAAFFFSAQIKVQDASGANPLLVGFRKAEAYQAVYTGYADYAAIGIVGTSDPNLIKTVTEAAGGGTTTTDTTNTWADAATKTLTVKVSAAGVVTYQINGAAPTAVVAFSFTAGDVVVPFLYFLEAADLAGTVEMISWEVGFQADA